MSDQSVNRYLKSQYHTYDPEVTDREIEVLTYLFLGKTNKEIGQVLGLSDLTIKNHVQSLIRKLGACNRTALIWTALHRGIIRPPAPLPRAVPLDQHHELPSPKQHLVELPAPVPQAAEEPIEALGGGMIKLYLSGRVDIGAETIRLPRKGFLLLRYLLETSGRVHSRDQLLTKVWGPDAMHDERTVDVQVRHLRAWLEKVKDCPFQIQSVRGVGYVLYALPGLES